MDLLSLTTLRFPANGWKRLSTDRPPTEMHSPGRSNAWSPTCILSVLEREFSSERAALKIVTIPTSHSRPRPKLPNSTRLVYSNKVRVATSCTPPNDLNMVCEKQHIEFFLESARVIHRVGQYRIDRGELRADFPRHRTTPPINAVTV